MVAMPLLDININIIWLLTLALPLV